ncbi:hypothetical protein GUJ93_ZPchr0001g32332 [Zizania palustris]|uniref:Phospholipid/glycerol acyltransferase domain-containing protein n=1 Tax=Zizania palustris TaxID=103762 RepID=A0A8J5RN46_ZIZPA|nr:hypothetical protein GUJ93_ZPchr0001g32332 [Zizania palustris]
MALESSSGHAFYRKVRRGLGLHHLFRRRSSGISTYPRINHTWPSSQQDKDHLRNHTVVVDVEGGLLRSSSTFPYFMLVAIEAGSFLRGLVLLCVYLLLCCLPLPEEAKLKVMVMVCFLGLEKEKVKTVGRATLPKHFLEDVAMEGLEAVRGVQILVGVSSVIPRIMLEVFLKDHLGMKEVVGREVKAIEGFYVGLLEKGSEGCSELAQGSGPKIGFGSSSSYSAHGHHHLFSWCQEVYLVTPEEKGEWSPLPREQYPRPLIFHDGRLAFRPTPEATLAMFTWFPFAVALTIVRTLIFVSLPYSASVTIGAMTGVTTRVINSPTSTTGQVKPKHPAPTNPKGHLYVCNHRTLLDPIYIATMLNKKVSAVTYSVSRLSEWLSPIPTFRLTRDRDEDGRRMEQALQRGDLVVCPEGTTCREPYLLRFSPLSLELVDEVYPVALVNLSSMFHGTSTGRFKWLDSFYYFMNPRPTYHVEFMDKMVINDKKSNSKQVVNMVQGEIGRVLGFKCTELTRRMKYLMLTGEEGLVDANQ